MGDSEAEPTVPPPIDFEREALEQEEQRPKVVARDPVCGMDVDPEGANAHSVYRGTKYYFCTSTCKMQFDADPVSYVG